MKEDSNITVGKAALCSGLLHIFYLTLEGQLMCLYDHIFQKFEYIFEVLSSMMRGLFKLFK